MSSALAGQAKGIVVLALRILSGKCSCAAIQAHDVCASGTLMGDVLVGATIICLGLINPDSDYFDKASTTTAHGGGRKVCPDSRSA